MKKGQSARVALDELETISPITENQKKAFEFWEEGRFRIHKRQFYERKSNCWETKILSP